MDQRKTYHTGLVAVALCPGSASIEEERSYATSFAYCLLVACSATSYPFSERDCVFPSLASITDMLLYDAGFSRRSTLNP